MKKTYSSACFCMAAACLIVMLTGCFKDYNKDFYFRDFQVEFDAASWRNNASGKDYPVLNTLDKGSGIHTYQVNLIGGVKSTDQTLHYRVIQEETTAIEGTHYKLVDGGTFVIPADSSFGKITIDVLDFPAEKGTAMLVLELEGNEDIKVSENYKRIGIPISLMGPPSKNFPLYQQLGPDAYFNTINVDMMQPGLSQTFKNKWEEMKTNLFAYGSGGRTPYNIRFCFEKEDQVRVLFVYSASTSSFGYAYASWKYKLELDKQGIGSFVFEESLDINGTNLRNAGVMAPILNYIEDHSFKVDWVNSAIASPREGAVLGGIFQTDNAASYIIGELDYLKEGKNTPRAMPSSAALYDLFDNKGSLYTSVLVDPEEPGQSQDFKNRWNDAKTWAINKGNREIQQMLFVFDPRFNDVILVMAYTKTGNKFIGRTRYWLRMSDNGEMTLKYIGNNGNAGVTSGPRLFDDYLNISTFIITRNGNTLTFTNKNDPSSYFTGNLGNLPISTHSFPW